MKEEILKYSGTRKGKAICLTRNRLWPCRSMSRNSRRPVYALFRERLIQELIGSVRNCIREKNGNIVTGFYLIENGGNRDIAIDSLPKDMNVNAYLTVGIPVGNTLLVALTMCPEDNEVSLGYRKVGLGKDSQFEESVRKTYPGVFSDSYLWYYSVRNIATVWEAGVRERLVSLSKWWPCMNASILSGRSIVIIRQCNHRMGHRKREMCQHDFSQLETAISVTCCRCPRRRRAIRFRGHNT